MTAAPASPAAPVKRRWLGPGRIAAGVLAVLIVLVALSEMGGLAVSGRSDAIRVERCAGP